MWIIALIAVAFLAYWAGKFRAIYQFDRIIKQAPEPMRARLVEVLKELKRRKDVSGSLSAETRA